MRMSTTNSFARNGELMVGTTFWKVGELAKRTGLTVRALHHYDHKGLVSPSGTSESGHRHYAQEDIVKLQQVISLKQLGFTLEEIKKLMDSGDYDPAEVLRLQMERLRETIRHQERLYDRLASLHDSIRRQQQVTAEQFMKTIEVMNVNPNDYFTEEQWARLKKQGETLGPDKVREVEKEWAGLIAEVRGKMESGVPAGDGEVVKLAARWKGLMDLFSGGDDELVKAAERFHADHPGNNLQYGMDGELYQYITRAMAHNRS